MERFFVKIKKTKGCWHWLAAKDPNGYGQFNYNGVVLPAHKVSYIIHKGEVPKGMVLLHKCDNRYCVNPDHLEIGTQAENMADMVAKGRSCRGTAHRDAKLCPKRVRKARKMYESGKHTITAIAEYFGVTRSPMARAIRGESWGHVK